MTNIYPCTVCLATFKNENSLKSHIKRAHEKKYKCSICDHKFAMKIEWENHRIACLSTECRFCDCPFSREVYKNYMDHVFELFYMVGQQFYFNKYFNNLPQNILKQIHNMIYRV